MKKLICYTPTFIGFVFLSLLLISGNLSAQESETEKPMREQLQDLGVKIPFIDRDGDGINDMLQNGWGLKFLDRYKKRRDLWEQLNVEIVGEGKKKMVDTNGDGVGDLPFRDFMKGKMSEFVDTDNDGKPDTLLREYLRKRFQSFDKDGDGLPDEFTREEIHQYMKEMKEWHEQIHERMDKGLPPFLDENCDGIPDDLPEGFGRPGRHGPPGPPGGP